MAHANLDIDLPELTQAMRDVCANLREAAERTEAVTPLPPLAPVCESLEHFTGLLGHIEQGAYAGDGPGEFRELSRTGFALLEQLHAWAEALEYQDMREALDEIIVTWGVWAARFLGPLPLTQPLVEALSRVANSHQDPAFLAELSHVYQEIAEAVDPATRDDRDRTNPARPWRLLNLNYGIVATRSHQPEIMEQAFEQLLHRLPEDAPGFFEEGMQQMEAVGYPEHVRRIMEKYYRLTNNPTLH